MEFRLESTSKPKPIYRRGSPAVTDDQAMSTIQPETVLRSYGTQIAQDDIEQQAAVEQLSSISLHNSFTDDRDKFRHLNEDPHYIADYLAHNTSKAAAVFRRYDKLAMYRLLLLSRELDSLEKKHNAFVNSGNPNEAKDLKTKGFGDKVGLVLKEYCMKLRSI